MFIRYNQLSKYFEYDASGGLGAGPWIKLQIDYSQIINAPAIPPPYVLPANVALKDAANVFTALQTIATGGTIAEIDLLETGANLLLRLINYQSRFQVYYNPVGQLFGVDLVGNIAVKQDIYEKGRGSPLGHWVSYTPVWNSSGGATAGGILVGKYCIIGMTCHFQIKITFQAGVNFGAGFWAIGIPVASSGTTYDHVGSGWLSSPSIGFKLFSVSLYDTYQVLLIGDDTTAFFGPTTPIIWGVNDQLYLSGSYQIA